MSDEKEIIVTPEMMRRLADELEAAGTKGARIKTSTLTLSARAIRTALAMVGELREIQSDALRATSRAEEAESMLRDVARGFSLINRGLARMPTQFGVDPDGTVEEEEELIAPEEMPEAADVHAD